MCQISRSNPLGLYQCHPKTHNPTQYYSIEKKRSYRKKQQEEIDFFETNVVVKLKTNPEIHIVPFNMTLTES